MHTFHVGQRIECVEPTRNTLVKGETYTVHSINEHHDDTFLRLEETSGLQGWSARRFKPVS